MSRIPDMAAPIGYGSPGSEGYCFSRYRSFDPITGTYRGRDGRRHYCQTIGVSSAGGTDHTESSS
jgi:hypothetical protein